MTTTGLLGEERLQIQDLEHICRNAVVDERVQQHLRSLLPVFSATKAPTHVDAPETRSRDLELIPDAINQLMPLCTQTLPRGPELVIKEANLLPELRPELALLSHEDVGASQWGLVP